MTRAKSMIERRLKAAGVDPLAVTLHDDFGPPSRAPEHPNRVLIFTTVSVSYAGIGGIIATRESECVSSTRSFDK